MLADCVGFEFEFSGVWLVCVLITLLIGWSVLFDYSLLCLRFCWFGWYLTLLFGGLFVCCRVLVEVFVVCYFVCDLLLCGWDVWLLVW